MSRRAATSLAAALLLTAVAGCDDPTATEGPIYPFNAVTTVLQVTPSTITAGEDTARVRLSFANRTTGNVSLSHADRCPRFAIAVQRDRAVFTLTPFCRVAGVTSDSITQTFVVAPDDSVVVEASFTGRARFTSPGGDQFCALSGRVELLVLVEDDGGRVSALPAADGGTVSTPLTVNPGGLPGC